MRGTQSGMLFISLLSNLTHLPPGSVVIDSVTVPWSAALGFVNKEFQPLGAYNTTLLPAIQNVFNNIYLGIAQGALSKAISYTNSKTRAWPFAGDVKPKATDEFYIQDIYGDLQAKVWSIEAQVDAAGEQIRHILDRPDRTTLTAEERGEAAVRVAAAKVRTIDVSLEVTSRYALFLFFFCFLSRC
jgi:alkylation response protein AidB-like acyl-CoA dehydrogenase